MQHVRTACLFLFVCIGNSMVSSVIWKKTCTSEFFSQSQNCTSPKDEGNLNFEVFEKVPNVCFFKLDETILLLLIKNVLEKLMQSLLNVFFSLNYFCWKLLILLAIFVIVSYFKPIRKTK